MKTSRYNILLVLWALMLLVACSDSSSDESEKPVAPPLRWILKFRRSLWRKEERLRSVLRRQRIGLQPVTNRGASCRLLRAKLATLL